MPVVANRTGNNGVVTITVDLTDILADDALTAPQKRVKALYRAQQELSDALPVLTKTNGEIDAEYDAKVAIVNAERAKAKAARPTGSL